MKFPRVKLPLRFEKPDMPQGAAAAFACFVLLTLLLSFHTALHARWINQDTRPPAWDESHHLLIAWDIKTSLAAGDWDRLLRPSLFYYPPLYHVTLAKALRAHGGLLPAVDRAVAVNLFYLALLVFSLFFLGWHLFSPGAGFVAAALASFSPGFLWLLRRPMIDLPLASVVVLALLCLAVSDRLRRPFWALALGAACGAGMLIKWTFVVYAGLPVLWILWAAWQEKRWLSLGLFFLAALLVAGPWYANNGLASFLKVQQLAAIKESRDPERWSWEGVTWYARTVTREQLFLPLALPAALGAVLALWRGAWLPLFWIAVPLVFFSGLQNKDLRYFLPALPGVLLLAASVPAPWRGYTFKTLWYGALLAMGVFFGLVYQFGGEFPPWLQRAAARAGLGEKVSAGRDPAEFLRNDYARKEDWKTEEILTYVRKNPANGQAERVSLISNHPSFHTWDFRLAARLKGWTDMVISSPKRRLGEFSDYILWKQSDMGPEFTLGYLKEAAGLLEKPPLWLEKSFVKVQEWDLPDGSRAVLLKRQMKESSWPLGAGTVDLRLQDFPLPKFQAQGLRVRLEPASAAKVRLGEFSRIVIECEKLEYQGLVLENVFLEARNAQINLPRLLENKEIYFMRVEDIRPAAELRAETLLNLLRLKAPWLKDPQVTLEGGVRVQGRAARVPIDAFATAALSPEGKSVALKLERCSVGGLRLPLFLARPFVRKSFSLEPSADLAFRVKLGGLTFRDGRLTVAAAKS